MPPGMEEKATRRGQSMRLKGKDSELLSIRESKKEISRMHLDESIQASHPRRSDSTAATPQAIKPSPALQNLQKTD